MAGSVNLKSNTCNKHCNGLIGNRYEMPNVSYTCPLAVIIMAYQKIILLSLIIQISTSGLLCGQKNQIGFEIGYGRTNSSADYNFSPSYLRIGGIYYHTINKSFFNIFTGLNFDHNWEKITYLSYIRIPLGIEINMGKKFKCFYGVGSYISGLLKYKGTNEWPDFEETLKRIQLGVFCNIGYEYQINTRYCIGLGFQVNVDITKLYTEWRTSPGGSDYIFHEGRGSDGFLKLYLKYNFLDK